MAFAFLVGNFAALLGSLRLNCNVLWVYSLGISNVKSKLTQFNCRFFFYIHYELIDLVPKEQGQIELFSKGWQIVKKKGSGIWRVREEVSY